MTAELSELEAFASKFLNAPTAEGKMAALKAWNSTYNPETVMGGLSPEIFWERLKSLGLVEDLLKWACAPSGDTLLVDLRNSTRVGFKLQAASMVAASRLFDLPGIFELFVEDQDAGSTVRLMGHKSYSATFEKVINSAFNDRVDLSYHHVASVAFLEIIFTWAKSVNDDSLIRAVDRRYVLRLVYYVFFDPSAFQPDDPPDKPSKVETMVRCGGVVGPLHKVYKDSHQRNEAAEDFTKAHGHAKVLEWCKELFVDAPHTTAGVVDASALVLSSLLDDFGFLVSYGSSDIADYMLKAFWRCVWKEDGLPTFFPTNMLHRFAQCNRMLLNTGPSFTLYPGLTASQARDMILLAGRAIVAKDPRGDTSRDEIEESFAVIQQYILQRHRDKASEYQVSSTIINCMDLVLHSLNVATKSGVLSSDTGSWAVAMWKEFMSKIFDIPAEGYVPPKFQINPNTQEPYRMCCWYRCPMYRMESKHSVRRPLVCSICQLASYCSVRCQRSDWRDGQHGRACKRPATTPEIVPRR